MISDVTKYSLESPASSVWDAVFAKKTIQTAIWKDWGVVFFKLGEDWVPSPVVL